jgi:ABC-type lipoprotein export system ATPase subunit
MTEEITLEPVVSAAQLGKTYTDGAGQVVALSGVSLRVNPGEFVAVCGPSGCGKSTLLLILGLLLKADEGVVELSGNDSSLMASSRQAAFRAENLGFVFQDFNLVPYLSVLDNVLVPTLAKPIENASGRAEALLEEMGLAHRQGHLPSELSAGERQRTALVRALLLRPKLILADEPTGNLDRDNADAVLSHLSNYTESGGAVVMATHDHEAMKRAGKRVHLDKGVQVESD